MQNKLNSMRVPIRGMHCSSCELLVENGLKKIRGIKKVEVKHAAGQAIVYYENGRPNYEKIKSAVAAAGYEVGEAGSRAWLSRNGKDYKDIGLALLLAFAGWWIVKGLGLTNFDLGAAANPKNLSIPLFVGLVAGFSTCMALVGGLTLGLSAKYSEHRLGSRPGAKFKPHLYFNLGRVAGFALLGGLLGGLGSVFQPSSLTMGLLTLTVAAVMLLIGLQLTEISPRLSHWKLTLPKGISRILGIDKERDGYSHRGSAVLGALTFFLPCGFTQAMQLYAVSTGSFTRGALTMALFALGTAPGLLSIGGITSIAGGKKSRFFFKFAGVVVIMLAMFNAANAMTLTRINLGLGDLSPAKAQKNDPNVTIENGIQVVRMTENYAGYSPDRFSVLAGLPVRWIIDAQAPYSCASSLVMPKFNIRRTLLAGENVVEFTPDRPGRIPFSCSMGMYTGVFIVTDKNGAVTDEPAAAEPVLAGNSTCGGGGGGCGGCGGGRKFVPQAVPTEATNDPASEEQIIKAVYTYAGDIQPNAFTIKAGKPVRFEVDVKENGSGCMSTIMVPGLYNTPQYLRAGEKIVMQFTPEAGNYQITCAMGVPRGTIAVNN